jgi:site-specific DNA-methyltransferase (adenine-specific)
MKLENLICQGDSRIMLSGFEPETVDAVFTSPPYFQMVDYRATGQLGHERTVELYLQALTPIFQECARLLKDRCILAVNIGDTQNAYSPVRPLGARRQSRQLSHRRPLQKGYAQGEDLQIPAQLAQAIRQIDGLYYLGSRLWKKTGSGGARFTKLGTCDTEPILFFVKQKLSDDPRLKPAHLKEFSSGLLHHPVTSSSEHVCPFPESLAKEVLSHIAPSSGTVLDPFIGSGTTFFAAHSLGLACHGVDLDLAAFKKGLAQRDSLELIYPRQWDDPVLRIDL